jgi:hypothetical protein
MCTTISFIVRKRFVYKELQWSMAFPNSFCDLARPIDMTLHPLFLQIVWTEMKQQSWIIILRKKTEHSRSFPSRNGSQVNPCACDSCQAKWNWNEVTSSQFVRVIQSTSRLHDVLHIRKRLNFTHGFDRMMYPNSFCEFVFARPIGRNLDPPFLQNPLHKNDETIWKTVLKWYLPIHSVNSISPGL